MAAKSKLSPELQTFKEEVKGISFKEKLIRYFNLTAAADKLPNEKRAIIRESFNKKEKEEFYTNFIPISIAIQEYEDRIRLTKAQIDYNTLYVSDLLSGEMELGYTLYYINSILKPLRDKARKEDNPEREDSLTNICRRMEQYQTFNYGTEIVLDKGELSPDLKVAYNNALDFIKCIKEQLEHIKGLLESLKNFLNKIEVPFLYPQEFRDIEVELSLFFAREIRDEKIREQEKYKDVPLENPNSLIDIVGVSPIEIALHKLVYDDIEPIKNLIENNLWEKAYLREKE